MDRAARHTFAVHGACADPSDPERTASRIVSKVGRGCCWYGGVGMARAKHPRCLGPAWEVEVTTADDDSGAMSAFLDALAEYALGSRFNYPRVLPPPADALVCRGRAISATFMPNWWVFSSEKLAAESHAALCAFMRGESPRGGQASEMPEAGQLSLAWPLRVGDPRAEEATYVAGVGAADVFEMVRRLVRHFRPGAFVWARRCLDGDEAVVQKETAFETFGANPHVWGLLGESPTGCYVDINDPVAVGGVTYTPFYHDPQGLVEWCVRADTQAVYWTEGVDADDDGVRRGGFHPDGAADVEEFAARIYYEGRAWWLRQMEPRV
jgi:hypothetical protein